MRKRISTKVIGSNFVKVCSATQQQVVKYSIKLAMLTLIMCAYSCSPRLAQAQADEAYVNKLLTYILEDTGCEYPEGASRDVRSVEKWCVNVPLNCEEELIEIRKELQND